VAEDLLPTRVVEVTHENVVSKKCESVAFVVIVVMKLVAQF
jgi:hypothetical protein